MRTFPVEHLRFLFRPASIWSHSGRSVRKSPGQAPIFLFPVSSFCPASIWSRSGRSENFSGRALTFSLSSSEHLVSQQDAVWENLPVKLPFSSSLFPLSGQRAFGLAADAVRTFPVEHLRFLFRPASIWSHSGRSVRKSPGQAPIFFFPVSSFCPASIWSHSGRSENFPGRALTFSLSSSEHLVSQRTQCEKISRSSSHFSLPCFLFLSSEHWSHSGERRRKLSRSVAPNYNCSPLQASRARQSRHSEPPSRTPWPNIQTLSRDTSPPNSALIWGVFSSAAVLCS